MKLLRTMNVLAGALTAQRTRMNVASSNLANARTTRGADGGPYQRREVTFVTTDAGAPGIVGVKVDAVQPDSRPPRLEFDPGHPDANEDGYVAYPDVSVVEEMVDMISASRAYEAGATAMTAAVNMAEQALGIGR